MVTVYIWEARYAKGSVGHASMAVSGGEPRGTIHISWWPENRTLRTITTGVRRGVHARLEDDLLSTAEGRGQDHTIQLAGLDETRIKALWNVGAGVKEHQFCRFNEQQPHGRGRGKKLYRSF